MITIIIASPNILSLNAQYLYVLLSNIYEMFVGQHHQQIQTEIQAVNIEKMKSAQHNKLAKSLTQL